MKEQRLIFQHQAEQPHAAPEAAPAAPTAPEIAETPDKNAINAADETAREDAKITLASANQLLDAQKLA